MLITLKKLKNKVFLSMVDAKHRFRRTRELIFNALRENVEYAVKHLELGENGYKYASPPKKKVYHKIL